jgi:hypothetical protein
MAISLKSLQRGAAMKPPRMLVYGVAGIGKTTLSAGAPAPIVLQTEDGLGTLDVPAFPLAKTFADVMDALQALATEQHEFKTLVVDSLDWLEPLVYAHTCQTNKWGSIEDPGYGKGYMAAMAFWRDYISAINYLRDEIGMTIVQLAHSQIRRFESPETEPYDRYELKLQKHTAALVMEHSDVVLFANYRVGVTKAEAGFNKKVSRAIGSGERVINTTERPAWLAKNRYAMPDQIPMPREGAWAQLAQHIPYFNNPTKE